MALILLDNRTPSTAAKARALMPDAVRKEILPALIAT
jgi:hypothetical protein